jgi:CSLREA domain-containing protein
MPEKGPEASGLIGARRGAVIARWSIALLVAVASWTLPVATAGAATIVVASTEDIQNGSFDDPGCTLRDAVQAANTNTSAPNGCQGDNAGADTIVLEGGKTYTLSLHGVDDTNAKGDLDINGPVTIRSSGPGLATINAFSNVFPGPPTGADRAIDVLPTAGSVTLEGLRIEDGLVDNGSAVGGGGGGILDESDLTIRDSEVLFNKAQGSAAVLGGGVDARGSLAKLTVVGSTIAGNEVLEVGGEAHEALGGGIASYESSKTLTMTNSTVSGNKAEATSFEGEGIAGGVFVGDFLDFPVVTFANVTVTGNEAGDEVGGIEVQQGTISGSLIAGNKDPGDAPDCYDGATSGGGNVLGSSGTFEDDCGFAAPGDLVGTTAAPIDPNLGTLVDNGGPTRTQVPNPGSPAIDRGGTCPETDQRGFFRAPAAPCDAGAVEVGATATRPPPPSGGDGGSPPGSGGGSSPGSDGGSPTGVGPGPAAPDASASGASPRGAAVRIAGKVKVEGGSAGRLAVLVGVAASCPAGGGACTGTAGVTAAPGRRGQGPMLPKDLGDSGLAIAAGQTQPVVVKLSRAGATRLGKLGRLRVRIAVSLTAPGTPPATLSRAATLLPPKPSAHGG